MDESTDEQRTLWCGNLSSRITEELLYELFLQAAPLNRINLPKDRDGKQTNYAFITVKHLESVDYAVDLLNGISLFDKQIVVKRRLAGNVKTPNKGGFGAKPQSVNNTQPDFDALMKMSSNLLLHNSSIDTFNKNVNISSTPQRYHDRGFHTNNRYDSHPYRKPREYNPNYNSRQHGNSRDFKKRRY